MKRRQFIAAVAGTAAASLASGSTRRGFRKAYADIAQPGLPSDGATLLSAPIELAGDWGRMIPNSAKSVVERMRDACLDGIRLMSDRQPLRLRVEEHTSGPPAVWLHDDHANMAWIIVDIGDRDWSKLAYQFGHELGHVLANSWDPDAKPALPCQWIEEALVEAFSLWGLGRLAKSWKRNPPFARDGAFGDAIAQYRENIIGRYRALADEQGLTHAAGTWFTLHRREIEAGGLIPYGQAASLAALAEYESEPGCIEAIGALNRWKGRSGIPIEEYFDQWETSCIELEASPRLPTRMRKLWGVA